MDPNFRMALLIAITTGVISLSGIAGCTYTVTQQNTRYYDTMQECVRGGGSWVPGKNSDASCVVSRIVD